MLVTFGGVDPLLKAGSKGPDVIRLQELLNKVAAGSPCGEGPLSSDGDFGPKTFRTVVCFQKAAGFGAMAGGVVDAKTWAALKEAAGMVLTPEEQAAKASPPSPIQVATGLVSGDVELLGFRVPKWALWTAGGVGILGLTLAVWPSKRRAPAMASYRRRK